MADKQLFNNAYNNFLENKDYEHFYESIKDLNITDNALFYFYKAQWAFKKEKNYQTAEKYIEECESLLQQNKNLNIEEYLIESGDFHSMMFNDFRRYFYQMAGEVYAINGKYKKSMKNYQKYQYYVEQVKNEILDEKDYVVLYSFRRFNEYTLADLINKQITVCHPSKMNDPFDSIANIWGTEDNLKKICKFQDCDKYIPVFSESFKYFRIRSFSANRKTYETDDDILSNILMWSFYADEHRGFCIRYKLSKHFIKKPMDGSYCNLRILPVKYVDKYDLSKKTYINTNDSFGYKYVDWAKEREVRLISYNTTSDSPFFGEKLDDNSKIEEIVFGFRCPQETKEVICSLIKNYDYHIQLSEMVQDKDNVYCLRKESYKQ